MFSDRRKSLSLVTTRWLPLNVIIGRWSQELRLDEVDVLKQELPLYLINKERAERGLPWIPDYPSARELPPGNTRVHRRMISEFCIKQHWPRPKFWFPLLRDDLSIRPPGRPPLGVIDAIVQEFKDRTKSGKIPRSVTGTARDLRKWALEKFSTQRMPAVGTIENRIRPLFKELRAKRK